MIKLALDILGDKETREKISIVILSIVVGVVLLLFAPVAVLMTIGEIEPPDVTGNFDQSVWMQSLDSEQQNQIAQMESAGQQIASAMEYVYKKLSNMHLPYKILMQSKTSSQAYQLDKFKADTNSVILGTGTYWEGINVEGESLSQVIIYKLPFPVPEPIIDYKMSLTENPIDEVAVPEMVIQLKQGVGRLIRSANDIGIVSILDPRVSLGKAKYADIALDALSVKNRVDSIEELHAFWDRITNEGSQR